MFKNLDTEALGVSGRPSEIIELALSYGFQGLTLDVVDFAAQVEGHGLPHARRLLDSSRLKISSFHLPLEWDQDHLAFKQQLDDLRRYIDLAAQLSCPRAIATIEPGNDQRPYHENFDLHRRRFAELADLLAKSNMRLGIEFLAPVRLRQGRAFQFLQTTDAVLMLLRSIDVPNIGLALDSWHWHLGGGTPEQLQALGGAKVVTVALADADPGTTAEQADVRTRRLPGETGVIDCAALLSTLAASGYDGPVTLKPDKSTLAGQGRDKIVKQAGAVLGTLWKAAGLSTRPSVAGRA